MDKKEVGANIKKARKNSKMTQRQLGEKIGKTESSVQKYESGETECPLSVLELIADSLNVDLLELLDSEEQVEMLMKYDDAANYFYSIIGYKFTFDYDNELCIVYHNGFGYKIPIDLYFKIVTDCQLSAEYEIEKNILPYLHTKFKQ